MNMNNMMVLPYFYLLIWNRLVGFDFDVFQTFNQVFNIFIFKLSIIGYEELSKVEQANFF